MNQKPTWQSIVILILIFASSPFLSRYSSKAGYFAEDYFSSLAFKIGDVGGTTGVFLGLFCEVLAFLFSITIIVAIFIVPIWRLIKNIKKGLVPPPTPSDLLIYFILLQVLGFFVTFTFFTADTIQIMMGEIARRPR